MKHWPTNISTSAGSVATEAAAICARGVPVRRLHDRARRGSRTWPPWLSRLRGSRAVLTRPTRLSPFAFPLLVEIFRESLTNEALETRVARMVAELEKAAQKA